MVKSKIDPLVTEVKKRARGRPRKTPKVEEPIKEEIKEDIKEDIVEDIKKAPQQRFQWDVKINDKIEFFDSNLSYELTGYIPINEISALDFDPSWFTEVRDTFNRTGHYCQAHRETKAFRDFWTEQYHRCKYGMTVNGYTITGDHYFFLNFYRLKDLVNVEEAGAGRQEIFPNFLEGQYEWFHYLKLARKLKLNACMMKARSAGKRIARVKFRNIGED